MIVELELLFIPVSVNCLAPPSLKPLLWLVYLPGPQLPHPTPSAWLSLSRGLGVNGSALLHGGSLEVGFHGRGSDASSAALALHDR